MITAWGAHHTAANLWLQYCNPVSEQTLTDLVGTLDADLHGQIALDAGCGKGYVVEALAARGATVVGYDFNLELLESARARLLRAGARHATLLHRAAPPSGRWDVVVVLGSADCFTNGTIPNALRRVRTLVEPGSRLLFGDGYWNAPPPDRLVRLLGGETSRMTGYGELSRAIPASGWRLCWQRHSTQAEWDEHLEAWCAGLREAARRRNDPMLAVTARLTWYHYVRDLRERLGFVVMSLEAV